jgi:hypothetical protein
LLESAGLILDTERVLVAFPVIAECALLLGSIHFQQVLPCLIVDHDAQLLGYRVAGNVCIFKQENKTPFPTLLRRSVSRVFPFLMLVPPFVALGVGEQLELGGIDVYYPDTRSMSAVDEGKCVSIVLLWSLSLAVGVVYDLRNSGEFNIRKGTDD